MTNQEAIKTLLMLRVITEKPNTEKHPMAQAISMAIKALEKQVPVKPYYATLRFRCKGEAFIIKHPKCPRCRKNGLYLWEAEIQEGHVYCHRCGQAIDWGDEDV